MGSPELRGFFQWGTQLPGMGLGNQPCSVRKCQMIQWAGEQTKHICFHSLVTNQDPARRQRNYTNSSCPVHPYPLPLFVAPGYNLPPTFHSQLKWPSEMPPWSSPGLTWESGAHLPSAGHSCGCMPDGSAPISRAGLQVPWGQGQWLADSPLPLST